MSTIGGNTEFTIQTKVVTTNRIGEDVAEWLDAEYHYGWLDMSGGDASMTYNTKIVESTHILLTDYFDFKARGISAERNRITVDGESYEIKYIDDPMGLHEHLEIYLKYTGGV